MKPATRFSSERLGLARRRRGLTKVALAECVGITTRRLAMYENEGAAPPEAMIAALADVLQFPVGFFYRPRPPTPSQDTVSFRSFSRLPAGPRDAALAASALAIEVAAWIDERFQLPEASLPDGRDVDPVTAAAAVRSAWALGYEPAPNLIHLLESRGVRVYSIAEECAALDGFSLWHNGAPFVFLTHHKSAERGRWDAAHELAHLVLHLDAPPQGRVHEQEADQFAAEFLLPERGVRATAPRLPSLVDIRMEKQRWRVSALAYIRRLHQLQMITDWQYRSLVIEASQAGYRRRESDIAHEVSKLIPKVLGMLAEDGVRLADIALDLQIPLNELRGLIFTSLSVIKGGHQDSETRHTPNLRVL